MEQQSSIRCWYTDVCTRADCNPEECLTYIQLKWQMDNSGLPLAKQAPIKLTINSGNKADKPVFDELGRIRRDVVDFVESGKNLCLVSAYTGNGKTSWAIRLLQSYMHHKASGNYENLLGMFVSVPELLLKLKDFQNPVDAGYKKKLQEVDVVVWDEIALTGVTQYDYNQLYVFIESRMLAGKSNIFTCNCANSEELETLLGARLTSRIWNASEVLEFRGRDERR